MYDATLFATEKAERSSSLVRDLGLEPNGYALATVHRAENTDDPRQLRAVVEFLRERAQTHPVVLPLHPRTRQAASRMGVGLDGLRVIDPIGYIDMAKLLHHAREVYTDSGGLQKEAYFHRVPCVTLRDETEWTETIAHGWNRLWSGPEHSVRREISEYGEGRAAFKVASLLRTWS
jgi:UDP-GlcNAc3NAcA epimerase